METRARYILVGLFTLAVIVGGFAFVYWLNRSGGLGERSVYEVRFDGAVSGLLLGSAVLFNGIRVGEVTDLKLSQEDPSAVIATIGVDAQTPVRADTRAGLQYSGLTGTASVSLQGGAPASPVPASVDGKPPLLIADMEAAQDWTASARDAFDRIDSMLAENSEPLRSMVQNIDSFAEALARNSDRVDKIVAGLERMTAGAAATPSTIYDLTAPETFDAALRAPEFQLAVMQPTSAVALDTQRFLVHSNGSERLAFEDAKWADAIPTLFRAKVIEGLENAGYVSAGGDMQGLAADRQLLTDIRAFRISAGNDPVAEVTFMAKIVSGDGRVLAARLFHATAPVEQMEADAAAAALNRAFGEASAELVAWTMQAP